MTEYNFGEKSQEYSAKQGKEVSVWINPKYKQSKDKAIELIESNKYGLVESDFWILMNETKSGKMAYTGLILSHNGCLKINDKCDAAEKFKPECADIYKDENNNLVMRYISAEQGIYEFGEVSPANCKNAYPYAMVLKRLQDRVILKTTKIAFFGILSEAEGDSFQDPQEPKPQPKEEKRNAFGLKKDSDLAKGTDMNETLEKANHELADRLIAKIKTMQNTKELEGWLENKQVQSSYNKLEKYLPEKFKEVKRAEMAMFVVLDVNVSGHGEISDQFKGYDKE